MPPLVDFYSDNGNLAGVAFDCEEIAFDVAAAVDYLATLLWVRALHFSSRSCFRVLNSFYFCAILPMPVIGTRLFV